jgi:hypothetical protein
MQPNKADSVETIHMDMKLSFVPPIVRRKSKKKDKKRAKPLNLKLECRHSLRKLNLTINSLRI